MIKLFIKFYSILPAVLTFEVFNFNFLKNFSPMADADKDLFFENSITNIQDFISYLAWYIDDKAKDFHFYNVLKSSFLTTSNFLSEKSKVFLEFGENYTKEIYLYTFSFISLVSLICIFHCLVISKKHTHKIIALISFLNLVKVISFFPIKLQPDFEIHNSIVEGYAFSFFNLFMIDFIVSDILLLFTAYVTVNREKRNSNHLQNKNAYFFVEESWSVFIFDIFATISPLVLGIYCGFEYPSYIWILSNGVMYFCSFVGSLIFLLNSK